ncbi:MAG: hypothetical protein OEQ13_05685, partial [Acidobacteriota bacterium]|nr:hypothetical protein [Acidobacteriota bacterium]
MRRRSTKERVVAAAHRRSARRGSSAAFALVVAGLAVSPLRASDESALYRELGFTVPERPRAVAAVDQGGVAGVVVAGKRTLYVLPLEIAAGPGGAVSDLRGDEPRRVPIPPDHGYLLSLAACIDLAAPCKTKSLFAGTSSGAVLEIDLSAENPIVGQWTVEGRARHMTVAPSGLVAVAADKVSLWDGLERTPIRTIEGSGIPATSVSMDLVCDEEYGEHRLLMIAGRIIEMWDADSGSLLGRIKMPTPTVASAMAHDEEALHVTGNDYDIVFRRGEDISAEERGLTVREAVALFTANPGQILVFHDGVPGGEIRGFPSPEPTLPVGAPGIPVAATVTPHAVVIVYKDGTLG